MPKGPEEYQPTPEEVQKAEEMMTSEQKEMSKKRKQQIFARELLAQMGKEKDLSELLNREAQTLLISGDVEKFNALRKAPREFEYKPNLTQSIINFGRLGQILNLSNIDLIDSSLSKSVITNIRFEGADMRNIYLEPGICIDVDFSNADLSGGEEGVAGSGSQVKDAYFIRCNFSGANLTNVDARGTVFIECNFSNAKGLESMTREENEPNMLEIAKGSAT